MFFEKAWADVTDDDISILAHELSEKMGGWVFHSRVDFNKPTPHLVLNRSQPDVINRDD